jgi:spermidine synthase
VRPWKIVETVETEAGPLELRRRGPGDFLITIDGRVLMNSAARRSEEALARIACAGLPDRPDVRILIGGLGMGITLRAALDALRSDARVVVAELHAAVVAWCRGPLAAVAGDALRDPRVRVVCDDVAARIARSAGDPGGERFDAILLDLYEGPRAAAPGRGEAFYGGRALATTRRALAPGGRFAVWSEEPDPAFERRLRRAGFAVTTHRPGRGGRRHAVIVATAPVYDAG